MPGSLKLVQR